MANEIKRPGGEVANRPLHFFWVVDCSGSMMGEKIGVVNNAIQSYLNCIPVSIVPPFPLAGTNLNLIGTPCEFCANLSFASFSFLRISWRFFVPALRTPHHCFASSLFQ